MISGFVSIPHALRMLVVFLLALIAARFANWAIYSWAHFSQKLGPWSPPPKGFADRTWKDHLPIVGWWLLRRESKEHGATVLAATAADRVDHAHSADLVLPVFDSRWDAP